jgi:hypothetical protein
MKTVTLYQQVKNALKNVAIEEKKNNPKDKPKIRMIINNYVDYLSREYNITDYQRNLLSNYACKLHPKN